MPDKCSPRWTRHASFVLIALTIMISVLAVAWIDLFALNGDVSGQALAQGAPEGASTTTTTPAAPAGTEAVPTPGAPAAESVVAPQTPGAAEGEDLGVVYTRKLRGIEERVNALKEKVFRSKSRLLLLRETVLHGVVSGAKAVLFHVNQLGSSYTLVSCTYFLDGSKIFSRVDSNGDLSKRQEVKIFEGNIPPGNHQVTVNLELRGNGFGVFSYLNTYKFRLQHSYNFIAEEGKVSRLRVISYEKNGLMRDFKDRPNIRYDLVTDRNLSTESEGGSAQ